MSKRRFMCLTFAVMFCLCAMKWKAQGDVAFPEYHHNIRGASFDLTVSETGNALELVIKPAISGDYAYSFSLLSEDSELIITSADEHYSYKTGDEIKVSFDCALPEPDETMNYSLKASFTPTVTSSTPQEDIVSTDNSPSNSSSSCGLYITPAFADIVEPPYYGDRREGRIELEEEYVERYVPREFSADVKITNVDGVANIEITNTYEPPFEEYSYY